MVSTFDEFTIEASYSFGGAGDSQKAEKISHRKSGGHRDPSPRTSLEVQVAGHGSGSVVCAKTAKGLAHQQNIGSCSPQTFV